MNLTDKPIPLPPAWKRREYNAGSYREHIHKILHDLTSEMKAEIQEKEGDPKIKAEWQLEGAKRVMRMIYGVRFGGRKWRV